jgi:hypothetical protein
MTITMVTAVSKREPILIESLGFFLDEVILVVEHQVRRRRKQVLERLGRGSSEASARQSEKRCFASKK